MLNVAFKEWAVICRALADCRQVVILRKGGIAEASGEFRPEHDQFLLYPTYFHEQQRAGIKLDYLPLIDAAEADRPPAGSIRFTHFARVNTVHHVTDLAKVLGIDTLHAWTTDTVRRRFAYRTPGLYVIVVRVYRLPQAVDVVERPEYAGCKTWVELDAPIPTEGATPVADEEGFSQCVDWVAAALR